MTICKENHEHYGIYIVDNPAKSTKLTIRKNDLSPLRALIKEIQIMPVPVTLTAETVCARIRDSVLEQRLAPGTKLTEETLCEVFGVSRGMIRQAFLLLSKDNIISLEKNKGAVVASPTTEEARQVFEARAFVEAALLKQVFERAEKSDIAALKKHVEREKAALAAADITLWIRLTGQFHIELAKIAQNQPMLTFLEQLIFQTSLVIARYGQRGSNNNCKGSEHTDIVAALEKADLGTASAILLEHLASIEAQINFSHENTAPDLHTILNGSGAR
ncbi:MAG: GntR family transcriptional regulator [Kordiimonadales bacterium]|nr:MAG: GntR family transcriptional regulator [Kordiimonadales bacterium]